MLGLRLIHVSKVKGAPESLHSTSYEDPLKQKWNKTISDVVSWPDYIIFLLRHDLFQNEQNASHVAGHIFNCIFLTQVFFF